MDWPLAGALPPFITAAAPPPERTGDTESSVRLLLDEESEAMHGGIMVKYHHCDLEMWSHSVASLKTMDDASE